MKLNASCLRLGLRLGLCTGLLLTSNVHAQLLATGDPRPDGAVLWARAEGGGELTLELSDEAHFERPLQRLAMRLEAVRDFTAQLDVVGLTPQTRYHWRLVRADGTALPARASFVTAPLAAERSSVKLLFGADLGGQGFGRLMPGNPSGQTGWPIFEAMRAESADFFVALGDMLYSDRPVTAEAPDKGFAKGNSFQLPKPGPGHVSTLEDFRRDWLYHRGEPHIDRFLRSTPLVATWDDHELVNDSGGKELVHGPRPDELARDSRLTQSDPSRPRSSDNRRQSVFHNPALYRAGRQAMFEWNPLPVLNAAAGTDPALAPEGRRLYRSLRWGSLVEVFMLDTRSERDPRYRIDSDSAPKTMLGAAQVAWLKDSLARSSALWKLIVSSVPLSVAGGNERDAQGRIYRDAWLPVDAGNPYAYGRELRELTTHLRQAGVLNTVFLTGDQHFSNLIAYDPDGDGRIDFHEANIGPLRAGLGAGGKLDASLNPTRLYTDEGQVEHTYGVLRIDGTSGELVIQFHDVAGKPRAGATLTLAPRTTR